MFTTQFPVWFRSSRVNLLPLRSYFFSLAFFLNFCYTVFSTWLYFVQCSAQATLRNPALKASILNTLWVLNCDN